MADTFVDHPALGGLPLVLGGNVFGWTVDEDASFAVLDAFFEAGGRMIDTAEGYSNWAPGNVGGESEAIIGAWLESRGVRSQVLIGTKTGQGGPPDCLRPDAVEKALAGSLERLRTDYVDLYYAHRDDGTTPLDEVADAFGRHHASGSARELGTSNYQPGRLNDLLDTCERLGTASFTVNQPLYNLVSRETFEGPLQDLCLTRGIAALPYFGLASGFLTGKYHSASDWAGTDRAPMLDGAVANEGWDILRKVREIASEAGATPAQVSLAWLRSRGAVAAPIASATDPGQVKDLMASARLDLPMTTLARIA